LNANLNSIITELGIFSYLEPGGVRLAPSLIEGIAGAPFRAFCLVHSGFFSTTDWFAWHVGSWSPLSSRFPRFESESRPLWKRNIIGYAS